MYVPHNSFWQSSSSYLDASASQQPIGSNSHRRHNTIALAPSPFDMHRQQQQQLIADADADALGQSNSAAFVGGPEGAADGGGDLSDNFAALYRRRADAALDRLSQLTADSGDGVILDRGDYDYRF